MSSSGSVKISGFTKVYYIFASHQALEFESSQIQILKQVKSLPSGPIKLILFRIIKSLKIFNFNNNKLTTHLKSNHMIDYDTSF